MTSCRLPSITEDCDVRALLAADAAGGVLPTWVEPYVRTAFTAAGFAVGDRLTALGTEKARNWAGIKAATAAGFTRGGAFTPPAPRGEDADVVQLRPDNHHRIPAIPA